MEKISKSDDSDDMDRPEVNTISDNQQDVETLIENLRWHNNQRCNSLASCFILNPERQIKITDESLNALDNENVKCNGLEMKNSVCNCLSPSPETHHNSINDFNLLKSSLVLKDKNEFISKAKSPCECSDETQLNTNIKIVSLNAVEQNSSMSLPDASKNFKDPKCKERFYNYKTGQHCFPIFSQESETSSKPTNPMYNKKQSLPIDHLNAQDDADNQFEYTIKQENIVSFVFSPNSPSKEIPKASQVLNDSGPEKQTKLSYSKSNPWSEAVSNLPGKGFENVKIDENYKQLTQQTKVNKCLCRSSLATPANSYNPSMDKRSVIYSPFPNNPLESATSRHALSIQFDSTNRLTNDEKLTYETILFREASLRGCYNIENILKETKTVSSEVEKEIDGVKKLIFSAIGLKKNNSDLIKDSILSILDIFKSWIKLYSHFERKDFKNTLEIQGVDLSLLHDFLQWQRVSRLFIDKMILALSKIASQNTSLSVSCETECNNLDQNKAVHNAKAPSEFDEARNNVESFNSSCNNLVDELKLLQKCDIRPINTPVQNKFWKQRCFHSEKDQTTKEHDSKTKRLLKSKFTFSSSCYNTDTELAYKTDSKIVHDQINFGRLNKKLTNKSDKTMQNGTNLFLGNINSVNQNLLNWTSLTPKTYLNDPIANNLKACCSLEGKITFPLNAHLKNIPTDSATALYNFPINNHGAMKFQNVPAVAPNLVTQFCLVNPNEIQYSVTNNMITPNPIFCVDADLCTEGSYIKPGSYNPPQKPANFQRTINNSVLFENSPVTGVSFHYTNSDTRPSSTFQSTSKPQTLREKGSVQTPEDVWQDCMLLADKDVTDKPESISALTNQYLLLDETSSNSSSNDLKQDCRNEDRNTFKNQTSEKCVVEVDSELKMNYWFSSLLSNTVDNDEQETKENSNMNESFSFLSDQESLEENRKSSLYHLNSTVNRCVQTNCLDNKQSVSDVLYEHHQNEKPKTEVQKKLLKKSKKVKSDQKLSPPIRKQKLSYTRIMTKEVSSTLQHISNCIWTTAFSSLVDDLKSDKDVLRLDLRMRRSLYFQAMNSKLADHSYDTLEQALSDFELSFEDIKNRNKGDKLCLQVVASLEKIFLDLVEQHFGMLCQQKSSIFETTDVSSRLKLRKQKKAFNKF